jgi:hypothetical protein
MDYIHPLPSFLFLSHFFEVKKFKKSKFLASVIPIQELLHEIAKNEIANIKI